MYEGWFILLIPPWGSYTPLQVANRFGAMNVWPDATKTVSTVLDDVPGLGEHSHALKIKTSTIVPTMHD